MDTRAAEPARPRVHGLVSRPVAAPGGSGARAAGARARPRWRLAILLLAAAALVAGVFGGLVRAGVALPASWQGEVLAHSVLQHAALMICGFFGTVVAMERAVALNARYAFAAPLLSGLGAVALLMDHPHAGGLLLVATALVFCIASGQIVRRQRAAHTRVLFVGALCWLAANLAFAFGVAPLATLAGWLAFLVVTIAAERLEMTRLMRRHAGAQPALVAILAALIGGALLCAFAPRAGAAMYGAAMLLLAGWLGLFDIARRTIAANGLSRFMALALLLGYGWLAVGGAAWLAMAFGLPTRDAALHAVGLGFIVSMVMAHAPVILPAVARIKLLYGPWFYAPLALLHGSLLLRIGFGLHDAGLRRTGAWLNALAMALFALTLIASALAWKRRKTV